MSPNLNNVLFRAGEPVRPLQRPSAAMKNLCVLALVALIASCHFDKLFTGGGGTPFSHDPPPGLLFGAGPGNAQAGQPLNPVAVTVVDAAGTPPAGAHTPTPAPPAPRTSRATPHRTAPPPPVER